MKLWEQMRDARDILVADAAKVVGPYDETEVKAFAAKLCGLEGLTLEQLNDRIGHLEVPGDFRHLRLTNLTTGLPSAGLTSCFLEPLAIGEIISLMYCVLQRDDSTPYGAGVWTETVMLPVKHPGTLELGVRFRPLN